MATNPSPFLSSSNELIGQQQLHLERRLSEVLFKPEAPVFIDCGDGVDPIRAVIKSIVGSIAFVQFCDEKTLEEVKIDQLVIGVAPYPSSVYSFDNLFSLRNLDGNQLMKPINTYIHVGHFFELIDKDDPCMVRTVRITENRNGFVKAVDAQGQSHSVLLSSERCKRIGWSMLPKNDGNFHLEPFLGTTIKTIVPWFLFDRCQLKEHSFDINHTLEVIDPLTRYRIIPGVVTEIINKYFFRVSLLHTQRSQQPLISIVCHRGSPDLLPANFCSRSSMRLTVPDGYDDQSFNMYRLKSRQATESMFDIPKTTERFDTNRRIEIYDEQVDMMVPATILRQHRHLLIVRLENQREFSPPKLFAYYDERLFNVGAAKRFGIRLAETPELIDYKIWKTEVPYQIVTKPSEHDPKNGKRFMSRTFSNASQFLPQLYVNFDCYKGPFTNEDTTCRFIDTKIASSHFQPVMKHIIHGVLENIIKFEYQKFAIAQPQSQAPLYTIKLSNPKSDKRTRSIKVEVCENAQQFPDWLRQFLLRLEICPNFISPVKRSPTDPCPYGCHVVKQLFPYMAPNQHLHNPSTVSRLDDQRKRQNVPSTGSAAPVVKRNRNDLGASNSDHNDLDEPLSTRRGRRNIVATKRHEILLEEPAISGWKRRQIPSQGAPHPLFINQNASTLMQQQQQRRRRNASIDFSQYDMKAIYNAQNVPPRSNQNVKEYMMEMASRIHDTVQNNLNSWGGGVAPPIRERSVSASFDTSNGYFLQRHQESIKAAAVRKANGPRMLFPQQMGGVIVDSIPSLHGMHTIDQPPRLQPIMQGAPQLLIQGEAKKEEEYTDDDEILFLDEDEEEAPQLPVMKPDIVVKTENDDLRVEDVVQQPQIQEYLRKIREQAEKKVSPLPDSQQAESSTSSSALKLPSVQLEKPGEYDTELTPPKQRPSSTKLSQSELDDLMTKYGLSHSDNPSTWENKELVAFIRKHHSQEAADFLEKEEFDGQSFFMIDEGEIKDIKLKRGPELNLKRMIKELKEISEANTAK